MHIFADFQTIKPEAPVKMISASAELPVRSTNNFVVATQQIEAIPDEVLL